MPRYYDYNRAEQPYVPPSGFGAGFLSSFGPSFTNSMQNVMLQKSKSRELKQQLALIGAVPENEFIAPDSKYANDEIAKKYSKKINLPSGEKYYIPPEMEEYGKFKEAEHKVKMFEALFGDLLNESPNAGANAATKKNVDIGNKFEEIQKRLPYGSSVNLGGFDIKSTKPDKPTIQNTIETESSIRKEFNSLPQTKSFADISRSYKAMKGTFEGLGGINKKGTSKAASDQALITLFNKMLDPSSVVREGEYARSLEGQNAMARAAGYLERLTKGGAGLTDENRKDMVTIANNLYKDAKSVYKEQSSFYKNIAQTHQINPGNIIFDPEDIGEIRTDNISTGSNAPEIGTIKSGYQFIGGNPADPKSWRKL